MAPVLCGYVRPGAALSPVPAFYAYGNNAAGAPPTSSETKNQGNGVNIAGTLTGLVCKVDATGTGRVFRLRKNGADANQSVSPTDTTAGTFSQSGVYDHLTATDNWCMSVSGSVAFTAQYSRMIFSADVGTASFFNWGYGTPGTGPIYLPICGILGSQATEANAQLRFRSAGTYFLRDIYVQTASSTPVTVTFRKGGVSQSLAVSVTATTTGFFMDTTHSVALVSGDDVAWQVSGQDGSYQHLAQGYVVWTTSKNDLFGGDGSGLATFTGGTTTFPTITGEIFATNTTEANTQLTHGFDGVCSNYRMGAISNSLTAAATVTLRKNGANGNQTFNITAATTGWFEDTTHTDNFSATDLICGMITGGTSGTVFVKTGLTETPAEMIKPVLTRYIPRRQ